MGMGSHFIGTRFQHVWEWVPILLEQGSNTYGNGFPTPFEIVENNSETPSGTNNLK